MQIALLGQIYPKIREVAYVYESKSKRFTIRYYLYGPPTQDDYKSALETMAAFVAQFSAAQFDQLRVECQLSPFRSKFNRKGLLDNKELDGFGWIAYSRRERDLTAATR